MPVSGVILAAGSSSRLGRPKQLLELGGEPIVHIVVREAVRSKLREVILVVGARADEVAHAAGEQGQVVVQNTDFATGQSTSMRAGLAAASPDAEAVLFLLGDQPEVCAEIIDAVLDAFESTGSLIVQAVYGGVPANPVLFARSLFPELMRITGDEGARSLVKRRADGVLRIAVGDGAPPGDVDTDDDYLALVERWANRR